MLLVIFTQHDALMSADSFDARRLFIQHGAAMEAITSECYRECLQELMNSEFIKQKKQYMAEHKDDPECVKWNEMTFRGVQVPLKKDVQGLLLVPVVEIHEFKPDTRPPDENWRGASVAQVVEPACSTMLLFEIKCPCH